MKKALFHNSLKACQEKSWWAFGAVLLLAAVPAMAQETERAAQVISKMQASLDLQQEQLTNVTPIIDKYDVLFSNLQKSIADGTVNPSSVNNQWQQLKDTETQDLSQYLKPYQLSEWRGMQDSFYPQGGGDGGDDADSGSDEYSNLPNNPSK